MEPAGFAHRTLMELCPGFKSLICAVLCFQDCDFDSFFIIFYFELRVEKHGTEQSTISSVIFSITVLSSAVVF